MAAAPEQYLAVVFTGDTLAAALWQQLHNHTTILARSKCVSLASLKMHDINKAVDAALDELGEAGTSVKYVLFGVPNTWVDTDGLAADKKTILKTLTQDLLLEPLGYVANHDALAAAELEKTGQSFSGLFILPSEHFIDVDRYVNGALQKSEHIGRSGDTAQDAQELLARLQASTHPKERWILLTSTGEAESNELEMAITDQLGRPLELMTPDQVVQTVITTGGAETLAARSGEAPATSPAHSEAAPPAVTPQHPPNHHTPAPVANATVSAATNDEGEFQLPSFLSDELEPVSLAESTDLPQEDLGFTVKGSHLPQDFSASGEEELTDVTSEFPPIHENNTNNRAKFKFPNISSLISGVLKGGQGKKKVLLIGGAVVLLLMIVGGGYIQASTSYTTQVNVWLKTETLKDSREFLILENGASATASMSGLQAETITESVTLDKEVPATGNKVVGDLAKGKVVLYNRTTSEKIFPKGTKLTAGKLSFVLDEEVKMASASSGSEYTVVPGTKETTITASQIGTESNLDKNQEFTIGNFATSSYVAKNPEPLSGGTSREIQAVAKKDIDAAVTDLLAAGTSQLRERIEGMNSDESPVLFTQQVKVTETQTSAKVGDEQKFVKVTITVEGQGLRIPASELSRVAQETFGDQVQRDRSILPEKTTIKTEGISGGPKDLRLQATISTQALPTVTSSDLMPKILGQYGPRAETLLKEQSGVAKAEIVFEPSWARGLFKKIPEKAERVKFNVRLQEQP